MMLRIVLQVGTDQSPGAETFDKAYDNIFEKAMQQFEHSHGQGSDGAAAISCLQEIHCSYPCSFTHKTGIVWAVNQRQWSHCDVAFLAARERAGIIARDTPLEVVNMPAPTYLCPSCGAENQRDRSVCFKCYAPLQTEDSSRSRAVKAKAESPPPTAKPAVKVRPSELAGGFLTFLREETLYRYAVLVIALFALAWGLAAAANFNVLPFAYAHIAALGLMSIGMAAAVLAGGVDLSLGPIAAVAGSLALLSRPFGALFALTVALLLGLAMGFINGILIARKERISATIITLCTGSAAAALMLAYNLGDYSSEGFTGLQRLVMGGAGGFPFSILLLLVAAFLGNCLLNDGLIKAPSAEAKLSALADSEIISAYTFSGFMAGLAGTLLVASDMTPREIVFSAWYLMPLAAVLIGGALLRERQVTIPATLCGSLVLGAMTSHMSTMGMTMVNFFLASVAIIFVSSIDSWKPISVARAYAMARANPLKATQGTAGFCIAMGIVGGVSGDLISRVPAHSAIVVQSSGKLMYRSKGSDLWNEARGRVVLHDGDDVYTAPNSAALLKLSDDSVLKLTANTTLRLDQIVETKSGHSASRLILSAGRVYAKVKESIEGLNEFEVYTPTAVAAVRGTVWSVASNESKDYVSVHKGIVEVGSAGVQVAVTEGQETSVPRNAPPAEPSEMSEAEKSAWAREVPVLENPLQQRLWESNLSSDFIHDNFDDGQLDPGLWFLRAGAEAKDVIIRESGGCLSVGGVPPLRVGDASYGAVTPSFSRTSCEGSVYARIKRGDGTSVFRLTDSSGRGTGIAIALHPEKGYDLRTSGSFRDVSSRHINAFGDEGSSYHRLAITYDAGSRVAHAHVDDMSVGYAELSFGEDLHFELVYEGRNLRSGIDCRYDNFETNIPMPRDQLIETVIAAISPTSSGNSHMILAAAPLSKSSGGLTSIKVQYPRKAFTVSTRLLVQGNGTGALSQRKDDNAWILDDRGAVPGNGDYIFRFTNDEHRHWTAWQRLSTAEFPQILSLRDGLQEGAVVVAWDPVPGADYYWIQVVEPKSKRSMFSSTLVTESHALLSIPQMKSGTRYFVVVAAHLPTPAGSITSLQQWQQSVQLVRNWLAPEVGAFLHVSTPAGKDQFAVQCGELRSR